MLQFMMWNRRGSIMARKWIDGMSQKMTSPTNKTPARIGCWIMCTGRTTKRCLTTRVSHAGMPRSSVSPGQASASRNGPM